MFVWPLIVHKEMFKLSFSWLEVFWNVQVCEGIMSPQLPEYQLFLFGEFNVNKINYQLFFIVGAAVSSTLCTPPLEMKTKKLNEELI